ncbi:hypothetical protein Y1Q_0005196 [Alligator mississippiensis]|uniref:Uncharacterized protein n=1 Tax=Alligator mississippiensis TaxID=8496 RepID=A0A151MSZ5_ALLMI|nr:hypothetical protein Y1Q_0005196 [Alligator mississippiensis]
MSPTRASKENSLFPIGQAAKSQLHLLCKKLKRRDQGQFLPLLICTVSEAAPDNTSPGLLYWEFLLFQWKPEDMAVKPST